MPETLNTEVPDYNKRAGTYDANATVQKDAANWLARWLPEAGNNGRCLELGAGTGLFTRHLPERFSYVESTDLSCEMLHLCKQKVPQASFGVRDAWDSPDRPEDWDYLVSSSLLQWAPDPVAVLRRWRMLVHDKGRVLLGFFTEPSLPELSEVIGVEGPVKWRHADEWKGIFKSSGLRVIRTEAKTRRYPYDSALHFWKSLHGTGGTVSRRLTPSSMLRFFRDYESMFRHDDGVFATWTFCRAELSPVEA